MKVLVQNCQTLRRADLRRVAALVRRFANWAGLRDSDWAELAVRLLDDRGIAEANRAYLDRAGPTDVIAFALPPIPGRARARAGQVLVNLERALEAGRRRAGPDAELALYLAHGCDHLAGGRDDTPAKRRAMLRREARWVRRAAGGGLLPVLPQAPGAHGGTTGGRERRD